MLVVNLQQEQLIHNSSLPLLITSCIHPVKQLVKLTDPDLRLRYTIEGLEHWLAIDPKLKIVLCDGSNYDFKPILREKFPGKKIEFLRFQNSISHVNEQGKGYGEGEIIKYALSHSHYLANSAAFVKCTGKLWVLNYKNCLHQWNGIFAANAEFSNVLNLRPTNIKYIDTRFYLVNKEFFIANLLDEHFVSSFEKDSSIENLFLRKINSLNLKKYIFSTAPVIEGVGGGSGTYYKNNFRRRLKSILKRFLLKKTNRFQDLICESN